MSERREEPDSNRWTPLAVELQALATRLRAAAASFEAHVGSNTRLVEAARDVGVGWSGAWIGYHSRVYMRDFRPVGFEDFWGPVWGAAPHGETNGDWVEYPFDAVVGLIVASAGTPDIEQLDIVARQMGETFDGCRDASAAIFAAVDDDYLNDLRKKIESLASHVPAADVVGHLMPKQIRCVDRKAMAQGVRVPPHVDVQARCAERSSYAKSCKALADLIGRGVTYLLAKSRSQSAISDEDNKRRLMESMMKAEPSMEELVRAALFASLLLSPRAPGLTVDELLAVLGRVGKQPGAIRDAIERVGESNEAEWMDGRMFVVDAALSLRLDYTFGFDEDPRDAKASAFIQRWVRDLADREGIRAASFGRSEAVAVAIEAGFQERDVDYTLEMLVRKKLVGRFEADLYKPTEQIRSYGIIGEQRPAHVRPWPAFSKVLAPVEAVLAERNPARQLATLIAEVEKLSVGGPSSDDDSKVLDWICHRFIDSGAPVSTADIEAAFPATLHARVITDRLFDAGFVSIWDRLTGERAAPTLRAVIRNPRLFGEELLLLDAMLRRAGKLRREKRAADAPVVGLMNAKALTQGARGRATYLVPSLEPVIRNVPPNPVATIDDLAREYDDLVKFLGYKTSRSWSNAAKHEAKDTMTKVPDGNPDRVFIIHGRNSHLVDELRTWLDSLGLHAKAFEDLRAEMGGSPSILEVIVKGMSEARGIIALFTPDEVAYLRPDLRRERDRGAELERWQARPNVIFEAGMAFALAGPQRTLLLLAGDVELLSDIHGIHYMTVPRDAVGRDLVKKALSSMGCSVRDDAQHHRRGNFAVSGLDKLATRSPFPESEH